MEIRRIKDFYTIYGFIGFIRLLADYGFTKLFFKNSRLIRRPFYIRGREYIDLGRNFTSGVGLRLDAFPVEKNKVLIIGESVQVNDYVHIAAVQHVSVGDESLIASKVFISDHHHGDYGAESFFSSPNEAPSKRVLTSKPVVIGKRVWIGEHVCIMPGVSIGDGSIIGAGSIVTKNIPGNSIAVGNPARVIKRFDVDEGLWLEVKER